VSKKASGNRHQVIFLKPETCNLILLRSGSSFSRTAVVAFPHLG
jgi:hypothetical protein